MSNTTDITLAVVAPLRVLPAAETEIARWDTNAPVRVEELESNDDASYRSLTNLVLQRVAEIGSRSLDVLDAGCGVGYLSAAIADMGHQVVGIDPSSESIRLASAQHWELIQNGNLAFEAKSMQDYADGVGEPPFDVVVCNMTLHSVQKLPTFFDACSALLRERGRVIACIPNPDTYLQSRSDIDISTVDLRRTQIFEIPFRIHARAPHPALVFYYHRPFRTFIEAARAAHLYVSDYHVPDQVGAGKPRDIAVLEFQHWEQGMH